MATQSRISRDDIERSLRALQGDVSEEIESKRSAAMSGAIAGGILLLVIVFLLGRRAGRKKTTIVEIRRV